MLRSFFVLVVQRLPAILLSLLGWGFDALPAFFRNPPRCGLAPLLMIATIVAVYLKLDLRPLRRGTTPAHNQSLQLAVLLLLSLFLLWFLPFADRRNILTLQHDDWRYLGLLLCCIGVAVRLLALKALGEFFSAYVTLQPNHRLVQDGIYGTIRNPLYLSLLLIPTGIALVFASVLALPIFVLAALFVFDRIGKEERLLAEHFGSEFDHYRHSTRSLIPFVL